MIHLYYCNIDKRVLYVCDQKPVSVICDKHPDDDCEKKIFNIDEPNFIGGSVKMKDGTLISDSDEYMKYLEKYIP